MTRLPAAVLEQAIRHELAGHEPCSLWHDRPAPPLLREAMRTVVATAQGELLRDPAIFWIDGGRPVHFSRPGYDPPVIGYNSRFVELSATLSNLLAVSVEQVPLETVEALSERFFLQVIAEGVLRNGDTSTAAQLMLAALTTACGRVCLPMAELSDLEGEFFSGPAEESMVLWFYGLAHEIGHIAASIGYRIGRKQADTVRKLTDHVLDRWGVAADEPGLAESRESGSLQIDHLAGECVADHYGAALIFNAAIDVCAATGRDFRAARFAAYTLQMFDLMRFLNIAAQAADQVTDVWRNPAGDAWGEAAAVVRKRAMFDALTGFIRRTTTFEGRRRDLDWIRREIASIMAPRQSKVGAIGRGLQAALAVANAPADRELDQADELADVLKAGGAPAVLAGVEVERLATLADSIRISGPDLEGLRHFVSDPANPPAARDFFTILVRADGDAPQCSTYLWELDHFYLAFLFCRPDNWLPGFHEMAEHFARPGWEILDVAVSSRWVFEAATVLARNTPESVRPLVRVLVEGTPLFDRTFTMLARASAQR